MANARSVWKNPPSLLGALLLLQLCAATATGSSTKFIDRDEVESVAEVVCSRSQGSQTQIGSFWTIRKLIRYFEQRSDNDCGRKNLGLLYDLDGLTVGTTKVCTQEKIRLIEEFHHKHISKTSTDRPAKILKNFFYHYANLVANICKSRLVEKMNEAAANNAQENGDQPLVERDTKKVDEFLGLLSKQLGSSTSGSLKTYGEISLFWNFIGRLPLNRDNNYIDIYGPQRIAIETKDAASMQTFQRECLTRLRPVYGSLALPVIKLIDLGYYLDDEPFAKELASRADLRRLIGLAQACEFMLPIRVLSNGAIFGEAVRPAEIEDDVQERPYSDFLVADNADEAYPLVKKIEANIEAREKTLYTLFSTTAKRIMGKVKSMFGKLFYRRKEQDNPRKTFRISESPEKKFDLSKETKHLARDTWDSLDMGVQNIALELKDDSIKGMMLIPVILVEWFITIVKNTIKGICFALYAVVVLPIARLVNSDNKLLIDRVI